MKKNKKGCQSKQTPGSVSDQELMERFIADPGKSSFDEIVSRYLQKSFSCAYALLGNSEDAEDAVQETFLRIIRARNTYNPQRPFSPWFFTILRNICFDMQAVKKKEQLLPVPEDTDTQLPAEEDILEELPETDQRVIYMRVIHGFSIQDIADALNCSYEAAKKRCQRALLKLQEKFS